MKALQAYIDRQNKWNACFGNHTPYEVNTAAGRKRVSSQRPQKTWCVWIPLWPSTCTNLVDQLFPICYNRD